MAGAFPLSCVMGAVRSPAACGGTADLALVAWQASLDRRRRGGRLGLGRRWWRGAAAGLLRAASLAEFGGGGRACGDGPSDLGSAVAAWRAWWLGRHHAGCALRTDLIWPVRPARCAAAQIGGDPCTHYVMEVLRADPGENLVLGLMPRPALVAPCGVITFLKASPWRSSRPLSATSGGNPRSVDRMTAARWCRFLLGGVIFGGVHGIEGPAGAFFGGAVLHASH